MSTLDDIQSAINSCNNQIQILQAQVVNLQSRITYLNQALTFLQNNPQVESILQSCGIKISIN